MRSSSLLACLPALLATLAIPAVHAQAVARPEVVTAAQREHDQVIAWRRDFHQHPELSNREERTSAKVAEHLRALGLKPLTGIAHHGVVAIITGGKPGRNPERESERSPRTCHR